MKKTLVILIVASLVLSLVACTVPVGIELSEVDEIKAEFKEDNPEVVDIEFELRQDVLAVHIIYGQNIYEDDLNSLIGDLKEFVNLKLIEKLELQISDTYLNQIKVYVYDSEEDYARRDFKYLMKSSYAKFGREIQGPEDVDGYETWSVVDAYCDTVELD